MITWSKLRRRPWATAAALIGFAMVVVYVMVIVSQGGHDVGDIAPWAAAMAAAAMLALVAANLEADQRARPLLLVSAVLFLGLGVVSILTIGLGFLVAGVIALFGANQINSSH